MNPLRVYRYMTPSPITVGRDQTLGTALELMHRNRVRHLPVLDGGALVGVVTERDVHLVESGGADLQTTLVEEAMTADPYVVTAGTLLRDVAEEMVAHKYGCAVVTERGRVAGIFTTVDALRALLDLEHQTTLRRASGY